MNTNYMQWGARMKKSLKLILKKEIEKKLTTVECPVTVFAMCAGCYYCKAAIRTIVITDCKFHSR